jgi:hypothetical protein
MPYSHVLDTWLLFSNLCHDAFETVGESFSLSLELIPAVLELAMAPVVNGLPIVIDDEVRHVDIVFFQSFDGLDNFVFGESLPKSIPCTYK